METNYVLAARNLLELNSHPYPGRVIILGFDDTGTYAIQIYAVMGRSENSRNRVLTAEGGRVFTEPADPAKMKDSSLTIYNAMAEIGKKHFIVSNGTQTDLIVERLGSSQTVDKNLERLLVSQSYEPDAPHYTPRITGMYTRDLNLVDLVVINKSPTTGKPYFLGNNYAGISDGYGMCIMTYSGDGNPLPPFNSLPLPMPLIGRIETILTTYWDALNAENRVALAVKFISKKTGESTVRIMNRFSKV